MAYMWSPQLSTMMTQALEHKTKNRHGDSPIQGVWLTVTWVHLGLVGFMHQSYQTLVEMKSHEVYAFLKKSVCDQ